MKTTVAQARQKGVTGYVSISRPGKFGNFYKVGAWHPYTHRELTLPDVLELYEEYLRKRLAADEAFGAAFLALRGQTLGCPCPGAACDPAEGEKCHGHVMARVLDEIGENAR